MKTREEMIVDNLGLVGMVARRYVSLNYDYDDLFQVGCIGLMKAVDKFDPTRGFAFSTLAVKIISLEIFQYFRLQKKHEKTISLHTPLQDKDNLELQDFLKSDHNVEAEILERVQYLRYLDVLETISFSSHEKCCMQLKSKGLKQKDISLRIGCQQSAVSRNLSSAKRKVIRALNKEGIYV